MVIMLWSSFEKSKLHVCTWFLHSLSRKANLYRLSLCAAYTGTCRNEGMSCKLQEAHAQLEEAEQTIANLRAYDAKQAQQIAEIQDTLKEQK